MSRKFQLLAVGSTVAVMMAGGLVYANATSSDGDQYCRTPNGYLRISTTGECRRRETPVDLPTASDYNALLSGFNDLSASNATLTTDVADLKKRLPTVSEACGTFLFPGADLRGRSFGDCDLSGVNLSGANLYSAFLPRANLSGANLSGANLSGANLSGANLSGANLSGANLTEAFLSSVNLNATNLADANLYDIQAAVGIIGIPASLPDGWSLVDGVLTQTGADTDFGQEIDVPLWNGGTVKATLSTPTFFNANPLGFPEFGRYQDDRAMWFYFSITNTSNRTILVDQVQLRAVTRTGAFTNECRALLGDDGSVTLLGAVNPNTWEPYTTLAPGENVRWATGFVCQANRTTPMTIYLSSPDIGGTAFVGRMP